MSPLDWEQFTSLPGATTANWERLCGAAIRRSFGALGSFRHVAQQPGVEFHLKLERSSTTLGDPGRWWGWQCRWYDLSSRQIGTTRRNGVEEAIRKTEEHVPGITDWVLWTRRPLTPTDQDWFYAINSTMRLHLWTADDLDAHLVGEAELLRSAYFGDLILTPERLHDLRKQSIAPIQDRWMPEVHTEVGAEHEIRKILGDPEYWPELNHHVIELGASIDELSQVADEAGGDLRDTVVSLEHDLRSLQETFEAIAGALTEHGIGSAAALAAHEWEPRLTPARGQQLARALSRQRHPRSFVVMAGLARQRDSAELFAQIRKYLSAKAIAVVGPAGCGKTHLGAELTAARGARPCGLYAQAWPLTRRGTVNELLAQFGETQAESLVQLLEALDAAGARAGARIPFVIDGLNESEDPAVWKEELPKLQPVLERLQHVVVVVTVRPSVAQMALPDNLARLELQGFDRVTKEAVLTYFREYNIDPGNVRLPLEQFQDPLFLRIFCEATNPTRDSRVSPEQVPASLTAAFIEFRRKAVERIAEMRGGVRRYQPDILKALDGIALSLWETNRRAMPFDEIRDQIGDDSEEWTRSLARALQDEGILSAERDTRGAVRTVILFDRFAGFLIADALIRLKGPDDFATWATAVETVAQLGSDPEERAHPLASDIRDAFVGLVPRRFIGMQFWEFVDGSLREEAIVGAAYLEGRLLDGETVAEIARVSVRPGIGTSSTSPGRRDLFDRFREVRDVGGHPLNAEFVDSLLSGLSVADRDLRWTEWIRNSDGEHFRELERLTESWKSTTERIEEDRLNAVWVKWLLTSTIRDLRDMATRALYWYGRGEPGALFELTLPSLDTNDAYVPERLMAASFGVMMAAPGERREFRSELYDFVEGLWQAFCADGATYPTDHWLIRHYVEGIVGVTRRYYPTALGAHTEEWRFVRADKLEPIVRDDPRNSPRDLVYGLDFANYTVGRLVPARGNYRFDHPDYQEVCSWIRARVWELGWRTERFSQVERHMRDQREHRLGRRGHIEFYQKKYGWVGFFEAAGRLVDEDRSPLRESESHLTDVDIDPSFPAEPASLTLTLPGLLSEEFEDLESWVTGGSVEVPDEFLRPESLGGTAGPWVALRAFLNREDVDSQRRGFGYLHAVLVERANEQQLRDVLHSEPHPGSLWALQPPSFYVFAGEMPWSGCARFEMQGGDPRQLYTGALPRTDGAEVPIELVAHYYEWKSYHSLTNKAGNYPVPAVTLAESFDLRVIPATLDWCDSQGRSVSMTLAVPPNFEGSGHFLYFREDLIRDYCAKHNYELVWLVWGEREVWFADYSRDLPDWLSQAHADYSNVWRRIASLDEVALT